MRTSLLDMLSKAKSDPLTGGRSLGRASIKERGDVADLPWTKTAYVSIYMLCNNSDVMVL